MPQHNRLPLLAASLSTLAFALLVVGFGEKRFEIAELLSFVVYYYGNCTYGKECSAIICFCRAISRVWDRNKSLIYEYGKLLA